MPVDSFWDDLEQHVAGGGTPGDGIEDLTPPPGVTADTVRRLLELEAHHLRRPELARQAAAVPQQLLARAAVTGEAILAGAARDRLTGRGLPALATRWRTRPPSPALLRVLEGHGDAPTGLVADPAGALLSVDASGGTGAWDPGTGMPAGHPFTGPDDPAPVLAVATSADGGLLATAGADDVVRVRSAGGAEVVTLHGHRSAVTVLAFGESPSGATRLIGADADGAVLVHDLGGATAIATGGHAGPVRALAVTAPGRAATGGDDGTLRTWDTTTGELLACLEADAAVSGIAVTGPEELLVVTADGAVHGFVLTAGVPHDATVLDGPGTAATGAAPAGRGRAVVTRADGAVELWRTGDATDRVVLTGHGTAVRTATAVGPDGGLVATGDDHGRILLWDPAGATREPTGTPPTGPVAAVTVAGATTVTATRGTGELVARDLRTGAERWRAGGCSGPLWSDDTGTRIVATHGTTLVERDAGTGTELGSVPVPGHVLTGRGTLAVLASAGRIGIADARTGRVHRSMTAGAPVRRAALTPDGETVLLAADTALAAWRPAGGDPVVVGLPGSLVTAVAVDDGGCHAVVADADGRAHVWAVGAEHVRTLRADPVQLCAAVAVTGHRAVTAGTGGTAVLWDLPATTPLGRAPLDAPLTALADAPGGVVAGDGCGDTHCLELLDPALGPAAVPVPRTGSPAVGHPASAVPARAGGGDDRRDVPEVPEQAGPVRSRPGYVACSA